MKKAFLPFLLVANLCFGQVDLNLGLRAYYPFSGNANDVSGNNNNPSFNNATLTADRFGNPNSAYHFNGTNNYMQIPDHATLNMGNSMSIALWVKPTGYYTGPCYQNVLVMKSAPVTLPSNYHVRFGDIYNGCTAPNPAEERFAGPNVIAATPFVQLNQWYSVVWTSDGITERIYVNCVLRASTPAGGMAYTNTFDLLFGKNIDPSAPFWFNGDLDEVRLYNRALNQDEVNTLGGCIIATPCNNWLSTPNDPSYATAGDLDVSGNQLTIEATFNRTVPFNSGIYPGHLVSKHTDVSNVNYSLFPNGCAITTTNGYKSTFENCVISLNKTYHVAMVYDGSFLKFYRNGFLHSQVACTGNMIQNNLLTTIAQYTGGGFDQQFMGYMNEVRIWNVARSQAQIQTYMNNSLPNPTTIPGLLGYYTFDNLANKQGNAAYNATLNGSATINATNSSCTFVADSCLTPVSCTNWLSTPAQPAFVTVGDLDIPGTTLTIEATANRTSFLSNGIVTDGDLVSKHSGQNNANYILRPTRALITTTNGFFFTPDVCPIQLNKTYHYAMVYNGSTLKFYRNGFLMSEVAATGTLIQNDLNTTIAWLSGQNLDENFVGYINEVRIWNVARTQAQIQTYMYNSLPNPTTQTGLQAYYTFNNLLNKQGNAVWNATLGGGASINVTNPNCTFVADTCQVGTNISGIINDYTPVLALNVCDNKLTVEDGTKFNAGDTVVLMQMKGAVIDSTNTASFGTINDYKNTGNYEFNYVKSRSGNIIELKNSLTRQYDVPTGKVQLIRVPYYTSANVSATLTCLPWDGSKGGVLVLNARDTVNLSADIDVNGRGFRGGQVITTIPGTGMYNQTDYAFPANPINGARKGEGIAEVSENLIFCRGPLSSGGGGGNSSNAGGGGGGNGGAGGRGGNEWGGSPIVLTNGGIGGKNYTYSSTINKIFMGGAGGAGHANDGTGTSGGNGGGIAIINTTVLKPNTNKIVSNGLQGPDCLNIGSCADGVAGGGAGGTVMINAQTITGNFPVQINGGRGANNNIGGSNPHGPGGGGGGGTLLVNSAVLLSNITHSAVGGIAGMALNHGNTNWGAINGNNGIIATNFIIPNSSIAFRKNIDSVRIKDSLMICRSYDFKGLAYINTNPINTWQWYFGDGATANTQNTTHTYVTGGIYNVKLVVTDINGCKDSISKSINIAPFTADAGNDTTVCSGIPASVVLRASAGATYAWTPAVYLNNPTLQNPTATIAATTRFYVTITNSLGCVATDSVTVTIASAPPNIRYPTLTAFTFQSLQLQARNLGGNSYQWLPPTGLNNSFIINPVFSHNQSQQYRIFITTAGGCRVVDTLLINVQGTKGIYVPKAFSPNGDGTNDRLYPILVGISKLNYFRVFNRWGNLVFETNSGNPATGWNGRVNGYQQPVETYTWTAEGIDIDGITIRKSGNTFLIR